MKALARETIFQGLQAKTYDRCSRWTSKVRYIPSLVDPSVTHLMNFKYHPWSPGVMDCDDPHWVAQKAAQMAFSEIVLCHAFHSLTIKKYSVLYGLPNQKPDASDFSATRFEPAIEASSFLKNRFKTTKNIGLKMAGSKALYIRGSRGSSTFKSIPVQVVILDEVDEMSQEARAKAKERMSGNFTKLLRELSTPSIDNYGINRVFEKSTKDFFNFKCPHCSRRIIFKFPESIVITAENSYDPSIKNSHYICTECHKKLDQEGKPEFLSTGQWDNTYKDRVIRGFQINQLYSCTIDAAAIATSFLDAQTNPADEQELYNSKLGVPHIVAGSKIDDNDIQKCIGPYKNGDLELAQGLITVGIDVGKELHIVVTRWRFPSIVKDPNIDAHAQIIFIGKVTAKGAGFPELDSPIRTYKPAHSVIDALPERVSSLAVTSRFPYLVTTCYYNDSVSGRTVTVNEDRVTVHRTSWLDQSLGRFRSGKVQIPADTPKEFKSHLKSLVRKYEKDKNGDVSCRYVKTEFQDHYAHAFNYSEIALKIAIQQGGIHMLEVTT